MRRWFVLSNLRAQTYLYQFYREVVEEALANGLDRECYYDFLSEMFFALPGDDTLRPAYENAIHETRQQTKLEQNLDTATRWVVDYYKIFSIQSDFLTKMVAFIEKYSDDDVLAICRAQLDFAGIAKMTQVSGIKSQTWRCPIMGKEVIRPSTTNFSHMIRSASTPPHIRKLGVMPCHSPVSIHTIRRFKIVLRFPFLLPPRGI